MNESQRELLEEARASIAASRLLLNGGYPEYAASRAYYATFYTAEAFLEDEDLSFSRHSAVIVAFGRDFAPPERVPTKFHRFLIEAQELRNSEDYEPGDTVAPEQNREQIGRAEQFLNLAEGALDSSD